jgi:hypothetical protein
LNKQAKQTETLEDAEEWAWQLDDYATEDSAEAYASRREAEEIAEMRNRRNAEPGTMGRGAATLRVYDVISDRGVVNVMTADGERGAELRAMRQWNVSRFWMEKNATVKYLYSYDPARKRRGR